jgi:hypothetical protein
MVHRLACLTEYIFWSVTITLWGIGVRLRTFTAWHPHKLTQEQGQIAGFRDHGSEKGNIYSTNRITGSFGLFHRLVF